MKTWHKFFAGLTTAAGLLPSAWAQQFPGVLSPTPLPPAPVAPVAAAPAGPDKNLWSFLCLSKDQKEACRQKLCQSQFGLLLNNSLAPVNTFTGGIVPGLCPGLPTAAELNAPGAVGAAAKIKK